MTIITITAKEKDVREQNINMSNLNKALAPLSAQFNGVGGLVSGEAGRLSLTLDFKEWTKAYAFAEAARKVTKKRTWYGFRKLPKATMTIFNEAIEIEADGMSFFQASSSETRTL